jgi:hypothetical protein
MFSMHGVPIEDAYRKGSFVENFYRYARAKLLKIKLFRN